MEAHKSVNGTNMYVYTMAKKYKYVGVLHFSNTCTFITNGLFISNNSEIVSYMWYSDLRSEYNDTNEYFIIGVQQCIDFVAKLTIDRNNILLSLSIDTDIKVNKLTDSDRIKLEQKTANYGIDITLVTHRMLLFKSITNYNETAPNSNKSCTKIKIF